MISNSIHPILIIVFNISFEHVPYQTYYFRVLQLLITLCVSTVFDHLIPINTYFSATL